MEHKHLEQLRNIADVQPALPKGAMSRRERLEHWATLLEREPLRRLQSLGEIELKPRAERHSMRADNSPLTVAFSDPVLRAQGLASDQLGDAIAFFDLSESEAHYILCSCLNGRTMESAMAARRIRGIASRSMRSMAWITAGAIVAAPVVLFLLG